MGEKNSKFASQLQEITGVRAKDTVGQSPILDVIAIYAKSRGGDGFELIRLKDTANTRGRIGCGRSWYSCLEKTAGRWCPSCRRRG